MYWGEFVFLTEVTHVENWSGCYFTSSNTFRMPHLFRLTRPPFSLKNDPKQLFLWGSHPCCGHTELFSHRASRLSDHSFYQCPCQCLPGPASHECLSLPCLLGLFKGPWAHKMCFLFHMELLVFLFNGFISLFAIVSAALPSHLRPMRHHLCCDLPVNRNCFVGPSHCLPCSHRQPFFLLFRFAF